MREQISLNDKWEFAEEFSDAFLKKGAIKGAVQVRIHHTVKELPYHYFDDALYQMLSGASYMQKKHGKGREYS